MGWAIAASGGWAALFTAGVVLVWLSPRRAKPDIADDLSLKADLREDGKQNLAVVATATSLAKHSSLLLFM